MIIPFLPDCLTKIRGRGPGATSALSKGSTPSLPLAMACAVALACSPATIRAAGLSFQSQDGRRIVVAVEAGAPITIDGALDEEVWHVAVPAAEFVQAEPHEGQPATEATEVRSTLPSSATTRRRRI